MKLTKSRLQKIIKEEVRAIIDSKSIGSSAAEDCEAKGLCYDEALDAEGKNPCVECKSLKLPKPTEDPMGRGSKESGLRLRARRPLEET